MAILKVARMGHPILRKPARELTETEISSPGTRRLIGDMIETMHEYGGIGLAAPQVHESLKLAIIEFSNESGRYPEMGEHRLAVYINPVITVLNPSEQAFWEGCLSVPEIRGLVHRPRKVQVDYLDERGEKQRIITEGFLATVFQHEFDHLEGHLFVDRLKDTTQLAFLDEYRKYWFLEKQESAIE